MVGFVLICELKDLEGKVRMKGSREFKGIWKEELTKTKQERANLKVWVKKWSCERDVGVIKRYRGS